MVRGAMVDPSGRIPFRITAAFDVQEVVGRALGGRPCLKLTAPLKYCVGRADSDEMVTAPAGFETDLASVPWGLWNLVPPWGSHARPAIFHDFLYRTRGGGMFDGQRWITRAAPYTRAEADAIFLEAMEVVGVTWWRRWLMYAAVRLGGWMGWGA